MEISTFMAIDTFNKKRYAAGAIILLFFLGTAVFLYSSKNENSSKPLFPLVPSPQSSPARLNGAVFPAQILNLSNWKLTLPITVANDSEAPKDIFQPELATFEMPPWFNLSSDKKGVVFRAPVNAPTTANSDYPRTELREMADGGKEEAVWPSTSGTHTLFLDQAITAVPQNKPDVVAGQIHGDDDDLIVIRLEDKKLFVARSRANLATLDENYTLGKRFTIKFIAKDGEISVYYNGGAAPVYILEKEVKEAYFKAGVYTQSNCETEEAADLCNDNNYGEVIIYEAVVTHQ
ncbi:MAG: Alginate lyase2 protein [Patescibacteria group bacterium]|nr:Alginate lyase2 protein [Patescibacteria group bacterium]